MTARSRIVSPDWENFASRLAKVLERLGEGQFLILSKGSSNLFVQAMYPSNRPTLKVIA